MKWVLLKSENDLPNEKWHGAARVFLSDLKHKYFAADYIELRAHITGNLIMSGIEWLDESPSPLSGEEIKQKNCAIKWITLNDLIISEIPDNSIVLTVMSNGNAFAYDGRKNLKGVSEIQKHHPEALCSVIQKPNSDMQTNGASQGTEHSSTSDGKQNNSSNSGEQQQVTGGWKKVEEDGHPPHNKGVLVFIPEEDYHITSGMWDISKKWVLLDEYRAPDCAVTHWMEMPEVPAEYRKEIKENNEVMKALKYLLNSKK